MDFATAGWNAVPTAAKLIARIAPLLGVEPALTADERDKLEKATASARTASRTVTDMHMSLGHLADGIVDPAGTLCRDRNIRSDRRQSRSVPASSSPPLPGPRPTDRASLPTFRGVLPPSSPGLEQRLRY